MSSCDHAVDGASSLAAFDEEQITVDRPIYGPPPKLYRAVFRALTRLWRHYDLLRLERAAQHSAKIDILAEDCVYQWLLARAALLKLEQVDGAPDVHVGSARAAVYGAAQLLLPHLRPSAQLPARARKSLTRLGLVLRMSINEWRRGRKMKSAQ